jgi:monofunctional biosynthetic peptidoglycan transglycosylase
LDSPTPQPRGSSGARDVFRWLWFGRGAHTPWLRRVIVVLFAVTVLIPVLLVLVYRFIPPPGTPLIWGTFLNGTTVDYRPIAIERIPRTLIDAVIASEDGKFCSHNGFDWEAIDKAMEHNARSNRTRGASTISQQTAKNLFLIPTRSYLRKGIEAYFTVLLEAFWPKWKIMEAYLNIAEFGQGRFGAEAAAQGFFGKPAALLTHQEAARLAAVLPNPARLKAGAPGPYVVRRTGQIVAAMGEVRRSGLDRCVIP